MCHQMCVCAWLGNWAYKGRMALVNGELCWETWAVMTSIEWESNRVTQTVTGSPCVNDSLKSWSPTTWILWEPTHEQTVVDLYCASHLGLVKSNNTAPGISDHDTIIVDPSTRAQQPKKPKRRIKQWSKLDWEAVKGESCKFWHDFLSHHNERTVKNNYEVFCRHVNNIITSHTLMKQSNSKHKVPWLITEI